MKQCAAALIAITLAWGCSSSQPRVQSGPVQGTVQLEGLTPDQQIQKIQNDKSIPDQYKQTYINSVRAKAGQGVRH